ncbi:SixA phosphatase family protein [Algoriphagus sp.]|uniref:SixA phosphatase family protein n=1 Tax=Algoriphagus sp. TaxID=1872435 RepID=UPI003F6EA200
MKRLFLLRHGEAGFSNGADFQRKLTKKGRENLIRMAKSLSEELKNVDLLYCSTAERTMETAEIVGHDMTFKDSQFTKEIYQADIGSLITMLEKTPSEVKTCLIIGHNPTLSLFLAHICNENYLGLQPGMMAVIDLEITDWKMAGFGTGTLKEIFQ